MLQSLKRTPTNLSEIMSNPNIHIPFSESQTCWVPKLHVVAAILRVNQQISSRASRWQMCYSPGIEHFVLCSTPRQCKVGHPTPELWQCVCVAGPRDIGRPTPELWQCVGVAGPRDIGRPTPELWQCVSVSKRQGRRRNPGVVAMRRCCGTTRYRMSNPGVVAMRQCFETTGTEAKPRVLAMRRCFRITGSEAQPQCTGNASVFQNNRAGGKAPWSWQQLGIAKLWHLD